MKQDHYQNKSIHYGISHTRLRRILGLVPDHKNMRVLEVGCANGRLGSKVKDLGHHVVGIDISEAAASEARKKLDEVLVFDIESEWPESLYKDKFDLVLLPEILEHVFEPEDILKSVNRVLKEDGKIVITTPNFMTWTNRLKFIFGFFKYEDQGMFDFGHIRWFTYDYLKKVLKNSGFAIEEERHILFPGKLSKVIKYWPSIFAFQFIVRAKKL